jgi:hypothetical protein
MKAVCEIEERNLHVSLGDNTYSSGIQSISAPLLFIASIAIEQLIS